MKWEREPSNHTKKKAKEAEEPNRESVQFKNMVEKRTNHDSSYKSFGVWVKKEAEFEQEVDEVMPVKVFSLILSVGVTEKLVLEPDFQKAKTKKEKKETWPNCES